MMSEEAIRYAASKIPEQQRPEDREPTITLYGRKYEPSKERFLDRLFKGGETANGTYKLAYGGVLFIDPTGRARAFVRSDGMGPVSVMTTDTGSHRMMRGTSSADRDFLGEPDGFYRSTNGAHEMAEIVFPPSKGVQK